MDKLKQIADSVEYGRIDQIEEEVAALLDEGIPMDSILQQGIMAGMREVGRKFAAQEYFLPEMLRAARTVKRVEQAFSRRSEAAPRYPQKVLLGTVKNDLHDIGKNLVALMLKNYGYEVIDLGKDVPAETIIAKAQEHEASIIALSALMTTTMMKMKETIQLRNEKNLSAKVIIGGAVTTQSFADEIGADGYSGDAAEAVKLVQSLLSQP